MHGGIWMIAKDLDDHFKIPVYRNGFTLVELIVVILIIALMSGLAARRLGATLAWQKKAEVRKLINTWELLYQESLARGEAYRLIIDLTEDLSRPDQYFVRKEILPESDSIKQVDRLENLRLDSEKQRRAEKELNEIPSIEEQIEMEQNLEKQNLQELFYKSLYIDPFGDTQLTVPTEFPSLQKPQDLKGGIRIRDVQTEFGTIGRGQAFIRFSPRGGSDFAVIHVLMNADQIAEATKKAAPPEQIYTILLNPWTGKAIVTNREINYEWALGTK